MELIREMLLLWTETLPPRLRQHHLKQLSAISVWYFSHVYMPNIRGGRRSASVGSRGRQDG